MPSSGPFCIEGSVAVRLGQLQARGWTKPLIAVSLILRFVTLICFFAVRPGCIAGFCACVRGKPRPLLGYGGCEAIVHLTCITSTMDCARPAYKDAKRRSSQLTFLSNRVSRWLSSILKALKYFPSESSDSSFSNLLMGSSRHLICDLIKLSGKVLSVDKPVTPPAPPSTCNRNPGIPTYWTSV